MPRLYAPDRLIATLDAILAGEEARPLAHEAATRGDDGTNDLLVSQIVSTNELQSWFVAEHLSARSAS